MVKRILFTGHMIDAPGRAQLRFPQDKELMARAAIRAKLLQVLNRSAKGVRGLAGGACGGDILFHELCREFDIQTDMYLALPVNEFLEQSVAFAGPSWVSRFKKLMEQVPVHILPARDNQQENVWERTNKWMLDTSLKDGGEHLALIALWDGKSGDGSGGTEHMIHVATGKGASSEIIDITRL